MKFKKYLFFVILIVLFLVVVVTFSAVACRFSTFELVLAPLSFFLLAPLRLFRPPLDEENRFEAGGGAVGKRPLVVVVTGAQGLQASILVSVGFL